MPGAVSGVWWAAWGGSRNDKGSTGMRKLLFASVAAFAALSAAGNATDYSTTVKVYGEIFPVCAINNGGFTTYNLNTTNLDANGALIGGDHAVDSAFAGTVWCNGKGNKITITAKPLVNSTTAPSADFTNRIDYTLTAALVPGQTLDTAGSTVAAGKSISTTKDAFSGDLGAFTLTTESSGGKKMLAGDYYGDVIISVFAED